MTNYEQVKKEMMEEFEYKISIDGELRYSTRVEPRLCDAEKTKKWLEKWLTWNTDKIKEAVLKDEN